MRTCSGHARANSTHSSSDLDARLQVARARVLAGAALPRDTSAIVAEQLRSTLARDEAASARSASLEVLARLAGRPIDERAVLLLPDLSAEIARTREGGSPESLRLRPEFAQFDRTRARLDREAATAHIENRPRLIAFGQAGVGRPGLNQFRTDPDQFWQAGVRVEWHPWTWGSADRSMEVIHAQEQIVTTEERALADQLARAVQSDLAEMQRLRSALDTDARVVTLRSDIERQAGAQFTESAISAAEYVEVRTDVLEARLTLERHRAELAQAQARYLTTLGALPGVGRNGDAMSDTRTSATNRFARFATSHDTSPSMIHAQKFATYPAAAALMRNAARHRLPLGTMVRVAGVAAVLTVAGCRKDAADAYGNFEATEVTVAAEGGGRMLRLAAEEGARLTKGTEVGLIDTTALALQRDELLARRGTARARIREVQANAALVESQQGIADRELERSRRLLAAQAATAQQEDRAERDVRVLREQLQGARAAEVTATREVASIDAQLASLDDRLRRSHVVAPETGTVLTRYVEPGELVQVGTPLFKMASLDTLTLRAYFSGAQLARLALGQSLVVRVDAGGGRFAADRRGACHLDLADRRVHADPDPDAGGAHDAGLRGEACRPEC